MKIMALKSFCGTLTMAQGEVREYGNETVLSDLLKAGYIRELSKEIPAEQIVKEIPTEVPAEQSSKRKAVKKNESK
jgi:hypothetical protein